MRTRAALLFLLLLTSLLEAQTTPTTNRQGTADLGMSYGIRIGPGMNSASVGDESYHNNAEPHRKRVLAWIDISNGYQHDSVSHAVATIERLGYETGAYDTFIRTDSHAITKGTVTGSDGQPLLYAKNLNDFDAIFFFGVREIDLAASQKKDLLAFVHDDGKGFVAAHAGATAFFSWPDFGEMLGGRFDEHPWGITDAPVLVEDNNFPGMTNLPPTFQHIDEYYQIKDFSRARAHVLLRLDVSKLDMTVPLVHHKEADFPLAWAKSYGKGRVYYSALGHDPSTWDDRAVQQMYFEALRWALHLTDAEITPRPLPAEAKPLR
ncbi:Trehalose utilization [Terriglobus roseus DSM 18391]|uniref:Trehalose utilization n=1 Tax=Terriglobus roseus (strain DSM 18391 / NRRL B-41598 / KBS 63) TaxID=926566 RepID=I3ZDI2_TERRK|nr:ThuA domain-containing protein [Terriglobus roseus]AFL87300.1 Trehalose utilization [Terriglobus roseus DSM 18391]